MWPTARRPQLGPVPWACVPTWPVTVKVSIVDGVARQDQPSGDLDVAQPGREQLQHFGFPAAGGSDAERQALRSGTRETPSGTVRPWHPREAFVQVSAFYKRAFPS